MTRNRYRDKVRGFSLIEMLVVSMMMALLATLMGGAWASFGRAASDVLARARIAQEASLAAESLSRDLSGYRTSADARLGGLKASQFLARLEPGGTSLQLCYDSQTSPNGTVDWASDPVICYQQVADRLVRIDQEAGTSTTIAKYLTNFQVSSSSVGSASAVRIELTFTYRTFEKTYTLIGIDP
jgi:prepilin-type N-terminal cleavage/methylation domain-containing protein